MSKKNLKELLNKYLAPSEFEDILEDGIVVRSRIDKEKRFLEVTAEFPYLILKDKLYELEAQVAEIYRLNSFKILPHYSSELFSYSYVPEILKEAERIGIVAKGFFSDYTYELDGNTLDIHIPFSKNGVMLLENASTPNIIEKIISSEFNISLHVALHHDDSKFKGYSDSMLHRLEEIDRQIIAAEKDYTASLEHRGDSGSFANKGQEAKENEVKLPRLASVFDPDAAIKYDENGLLRLGNTTFDISKPQFIIGVEFEIRPIPISSVT